MVSDLQYLIEDDISGNEVPSVPPTKKTKVFIGSAESIKSTKINDTETLADSATTGTKLMKFMTNMSLNRPRRKTSKYVRT